MFTADDLTGVDQLVARRVIAVARSIAPCIDSLDEDAKADAIAILRGVVGEVPATGQRRVKSLSRNGTSLTYAEASELFTSEDRAALRALCGATGGPTPLGRFPRPDATVSRLWPETYG